MNILVLQLCIVQVISIVAQPEFLQQIPDDQFMATRYTDVICKDQRFTCKKFLIQMVFVIDDQRFPAFHIQRAIVNAISFIAMDLSAETRNRG